MKGKVKESIFAYMNAMSIREYRYFEFSAIAGAIRAEYDVRKRSGMVINGKDGEGEIAH